MTPDLIFQNTQFIPIEVIDWLFVTFISSCSLTIGYVLGFHQGRKP